MTSIELHHPPHFGHVVREQFKATALSLRIPGLIAAFIAAVATFLALADFLRGRGGVEFAPELSMIPAFAGALLPIAVWYGERQFGAGFLWTLPVDRTRHALAKIFAGWLWLMIAVTGFVLWLLILASITKGNISSDEVVRLLPRFAQPEQGFDPSMLRIVRWIPQRALWLVPFSAATGLYAFVSAIALGLKHPMRWIAGGMASAFLIAALGQGLGSETFWLRSGHILVDVMYGRYGIDGLLTARAESLHTVVTLSNGQRVTAWHSLPVISEWIAATLLWSGLAIAALIAAVLRHRERR